MKRSYCTHVARPVHVITSLPLLPHSGNRARLLRPTTHIQVPIFTLNSVSEGFQSAGWAAFRRDAVFLCSTCKGNADAI